MKGPITFSGLHGETATYEFRPEYLPSDYHQMQRLLDDPTLRSWVGIKFSHDDCIKLVITNGAMI